MLFKNHQWAITRYGTETVEGETQCQTDAFRLTDTTRRNGISLQHWPVHLAEKEKGVRIEPFVEVAPHGLEYLRGDCSSVVDPDVLGRNAAKTRRIAKEGR